MLEPVFTTICPAHFFRPVTSAWAPRLSNVWHRNREPPVRLMRGVCQPRLAKHGRVPCGGHAGVPPARAPTRPPRPSSRNHWVSSAGLPPVNSFGFSSSFVSAFCGVAVFIVSNPPIHAANNHGSAVLTGTFDQVPSLHLEIDKAVPKVTARRV
jgi:hypothetical protein